MRMATMIVLGVALGVTGCLDRPPGSVTDLADPISESDGFGRMVEVIGPTWPILVEEYGPPPADPTIPWLYLRSDGRSWGAIEGFGPWSWVQESPWSWSVAGGDAWALELTELSGRVYAAEDVQRLGERTALALIDSYYLRNAERTLAERRASHPGPGTAAGALEIRALEQRIVRLRHSVDAWRSRELAEEEEDGPCEEQPTISSPNTDQQVDRAGPGNRHAVVRASGSHHTDVKAIHTVSTTIKVLLNGIIPIRESDPDPRYDGSCDNKMSPISRPFPLRISV